MIDVEIRGPIAKKAYEKLKKLLETAGDKVRSEHHVALLYKDRGYHNRELALKHKNGASVIEIATGKPGDKEGISVPLAKGAFRNGLRMLAELGYTKGIISAREVLTAEYGGAVFSIYDPGEDYFYYEAVVVAQDPTTVKEAKAKLEKLARTLKLPVWTPLDMLAFTQKLNAQVDQPYDYDTESLELFLAKYKP